MLGIPFDLSLVVDWGAVTAVTIQRCKKDRRRLKKGLPIKTSISEKLKRTLECLDNFDVCGRVVSIRPQSSIWERLTVLSLLLKLVLLVLNIKLLRLEPGEESAIVVLLCRETYLLKLRPTS